VLHIPPTNKIFKNENNIFYKRSRIYGCCYSDCDLPFVTPCILVCVRQCFRQKFCASFRVAVRTITMQSNYTGGLTAHSCANSISRLCATLYIEVAGKVVTQTIPHNFDPADGGSKFLRDVCTSVLHYTVSQNPNSAQLSVSVSVAACRQYVNELPPRAIPHILRGKPAEPRDYPHMVSGQAIRCYRTTFRSRSQANVPFI